MIWVNTPQLREIAEVEFADIVAGTVGTEDNMRIFLRDGSFVDVWFSPRRQGRYSYHWERQAIDRTIYRHDNAPHTRWEYVSTFPKHFREGSEENVADSHISHDPATALREFLTFARTKLVQG
jgi:hypothetical protein